METALTAYSPGVMQSVESYGKMIAKGGLFGCKNESQGQTLVLMALSEGLPITEMRRRYHIVGNDLSMRADFMRAEFRRLGGKYSWKDQGDGGKQSVMLVEYAGESLEVKYTIEDAKREGLVKPKSRWVTAPGDMLRARVSTKAIRMICSEVLAGFATDEEIDSGDGSPVEVASAPAAPPVDASSVSSPEPSIPAESSQLMASGEQISRLAELFDALGMTPEQQIKAFRKRGADEIVQLTMAAAQDLVDALENRLKATADSVSGESSQPVDAVSAPVDAPVSQGLVDEIRSLLKQMAQLEGQANIGERVKKKLQDCGLQKIADLSESDARKFRDMLAIKNIDAFFAMDLKRAAAKNA